MTKENKKQQELTSLCRAKAAAQMRAFTERPEYWGLCNGTLRACLLAQADVVLECAGMTEEPFDGIPLNQKLRQLAADLDASAKELE